MDIDDAKRLRERWGNKPCEHPAFHKERVMGSHTGEYVCDQCGRSFDSSEREAVEAKRKGKGTT